MNTTYLNIPHQALLQWVVQHVLETARASACESRARKGLLPPCLVQGKLLHPDLPLVSSMLTVSQAAQCNNGTFSRDSAESGMPRSCTPAAGVSWGRALLSLWDLGTISFHICHGSHYHICAKFRQQRKVHLSHSLYLKVGSCLRAKACLTNQETNTPLRWGHGREREYPTAG